MTPACYGDLPTAGVPVTRPIRHCVVVPTGQPGSAGSRPPDTDGGERDDADNIRIGGAGLGLMAVHPGRAVGLGLIGPGRTGMDGKKVEC